VPGGQLIVRFHALRRSRHAEFVTENGHRTHNGAAVMVFVDLTDKRPVDLDPVEREFEKIAQR
jgi:hypothetical protein